MFLKESWKKMLSLEFLTRVFVLCIYLTCLFLIAMVNLIIRLILNSCLLISWVEQLFEQELETIYYETAERGQVPKRYRSQTMEDIERDIKSYVNVILMLWCPTDILHPDEFEWLLVKFRMNFEIPVAWNTVNFFSCRSVFGRVITKLINGKGVVTYIKALMFKSYRLYCSFLIYLCFVYVCHMILCLCAILRLVISLSCSLCLRIVCLKQSYETEPESNFDEVSENQKMSVARLEKERNIRESIREDFCRHLLVWCPTEIVRPDFLATSFGKFDRKVDIRNRWSSIPGVSSTAIFGGFKVQFSLEANLHQAAKALAVSSRCIKMISASRLLSLIVSAEACHPMCGLKRTELIIRGRISFESFLFQKMAKKLFSDFGEIVEIYFPERQRPWALEVICKIKYVFASHAYAAQLYFNGSHLKHIKVIHLDVIETVYEKQIMKMVRRKLIMHSEQNRFAYI